MIFRPELCKKILAGTKTQTRRPIKADADCRYQPGKSYALQPGRAKQAIGRITIDAVRIERLGDLSIKDAKREGFITIADFFAYWHDLYGHVDRDQHVWVISFRLGDWTDTPRLLAARPGAPHGDYVSNPHLALQDEGEAISGYEQAQLSHAAFQRDDSNRRAAIRAATDAIEQQIASVRALDPGTRVTKAVDRIQRTTDALKRIA